MKKMIPFNGTFFVRRTFGYVFESFSLYCMNSQTTLESVESFLARLVFSYIQNFSPLVPIMLDIDNLLKALSECQCLTIAIYL